MGRRATALLTIFAACVAPGVAHAAEELTLTSFDGTKLSATFTPGAGLAPGAKAPVVLMTHGFGLTKETVERGGDLTGALGQVGAGAFRARGFHTLTYDSRGFGRSGGEVQLDSPEFEGRDASALIDYLATRPDVLLDGPGDPRVGQHGASYGGGIQFATALRDRRIDALAPAISFISLTDALVRDGRVKLGWGLGLVGLGTATGATLGLFAPQGPETGGLQPELIALAAQAAVNGGTAPPALTEYLRSREVGDRAGQVQAPTLIVHGTVDTIFSPSQAMRMRELLRGARTPTKMLWFCGGHGACLTGNGAADVIEPRVLAWMERWLRRDPSVDTGPGFQWVADDGRLYEAPDFPLAGAGTLRATGSGTLPVTPLSTLTGFVIGGTPALSAVTADVPPPAQPGHVVGEPEVTIRYSGTAVPAVTHLYGQVVDTRRNVVVGNQVTPLPVTLDGTERTITRRMEGIAARVTPDSRLALQVIDGSNLYGITQAAGSVRIAEATMTLPLGDPAATPADPATAATGSTAAAAARRTCASRRTVTLTLRRGAQRLRSATVLVNGRRVAARRMARGRVRFSLVGRRAGRVVVRARGFTAAGRRVSTVRRYRVCASATVRARR